MATGTGKNIRTQSITVGANDVNLHYMIPCSEAGVAVPVFSGAQVGEQVAVVADGDKFVRGVQSANCGVAGIEPVLMGYSDGTNLQNWDKNVGVSGTVTTSGTVASHPVSVPGPISGVVSVSGTVNGDYSHSWLSYAFTNQSATTGRIISSAGTLGGWYIYNPNTLATYLQVFTIGTTVTVGTTVPSMVFGIPGGAAANVMDGKGLVCASGIAIAATANPTTNTAPSAAIVATIFYR
jgi:hypothetical protein